jgi:hypothetical protein
MENTQERKGNETWSFWKIIGGDVGTYSRKP